MSLAGKDTAVFERGDFVYLVSAIAPFDPADSEIEEFSFGRQIREIAPNPHLMWLHGTYVEAGKPVDHSTHELEWSADDLAIKSLTPVFCPVTVMHDPRKAVGLIANTSLVPGDGSGPTRIDNILAVWKHRFPEVAEEVSANHLQGSLMQSQECRPSYWECGDCGQRFLEKLLISEHQQTEHSLNQKPVRKLGNVTFTGTGLIFGTRGARGALKSASLSLLEDEVSEFHERSRSDKPAPTRRNSKVDIEQKTYEELVAKAGKVDDLEGRLRTAEEVSAKVPDLERKVETLEIEKKNAEDARDSEKSQREQLEEKSRAQTLGTDRFSKLGEGFVAKLPDSVKAKLEEQSRSLSDEEWTARLDELSALVNVKPDAAGEGGGEGSGGGSGEGELSREETSRTGTPATGNGGSGSDAGAAAGREQVVSGVLRRLGPPKKEPAESK